MSAAARVDVIIVTYNSRRFFPRLRAALERQTAAFSLYVVDNGSALDERPNADDFPPAAQIMQMESNLGFAAGNNRAADLCQSAFIALLNPDAFPEPNWLEELLAAADRWPRAVAFGSTQIAAEDESRYDGMGDCYSIAGIPWRGGYGWPIATTAEEGEIFSPCAAAALYRADAWRAAQGFDESFFCYCEDVDLGFRLRLAGGACVQAPRAIVRHVGGASSGRRSRFAVFHGTRNRMWTYLKNMPTALLLLSLPAHIAATLAFLLISPFRGTGRATWAGVGAALAGLGPVLRARQRVQRARRATSGALARIISWRPGALLARAPIVRPKSVGV